MYLWATVLPGPYRAFHKFGITGQYLSQYICLLDNTREHFRDPIFYFFYSAGGGWTPPPLQTTPRAASRTGIRPVIVQSQTINILRTTSKIQATPLRIVSVRRGVKTTALAGPTHRFCVISAGETGKSCRELPGVKEHYCPQNNTAGRQYYTGVKEHYCPQNNTAGRQYYTGTKLPGGGGAGMYLYITASPEQHCPP